MKNYDVAVIGAGPGGYVAAIRCAQLGLSTVCIDDTRNASGQPSPGGTCLNIGCIPSKALLDSSHHYYRLCHELGEHGIHAGDVSIDIATMMRRKDKVVATLTKGVAGLLRKNKVTSIAGRARLNGNQQIEITVAGDEAKPLISAGSIIIATGSVPAKPGSIPLDGDRVVDSTGALMFAEIPQRLGVIGAGVIGLELGSVWSRLGSEVTILEAIDGFLPAAEPDIAAETRKQLEAQGLTIRLGAKVTATRVSNAQVTVAFQDSDGDHQLTVDRLLVAVGRKPNTEGLGVAEAGLALDERGFIPVDEHCATNVPGIFAVGDVVRGPMLAHKASEEGVMVAERIAGQAGHVNYNTVPWVIYTHPEVAWVGQTSQALTAQGAAFRAGQFPLLASGRARAMGDTAGLVKILSDSRTDRILGVHIVAPNASELIAEAVLAMEFGASAEDIARTVHAHPTLAEAVHEAALAVDKRAIHF